MPPIMSPSMSPSMAMTVLRRLTQAGQADTTAFSPPAVPRRALVLALATVTAAYFLIDRPAADAAAPAAAAPAAAAATAVAGATVATAGARQTLKSGPVAYYRFINTQEVVYEE